MLHFLFMLFTPELQHNHCIIYDEEFTFSGYKVKNQTAADTFIRSCVKDIELLIMKGCISSSPCLPVPLYTPTHTRSPTQKNVHFVWKRLLGHICQWFRFPPDETRGELISKSYFSSFAGEIPVDLRIPPHIPECGAPFTPYIVLCPPQHSS